jgi:predicted ester cyclase
LRLSKASFATPETSAEFKVETIVVDAEEMALKLSATNTSSSSIFPLPISPWGKVVAIQGFSVAVAKLKI